MFDLDLMGPYAPFFFFVASLLAVSALERRFPAAMPGDFTLGRWILGVGLWSMTSVAYIAAVMAVDHREATSAGDAGVGSLQLAKILLGILLIDFLHYWFHRLLHRVPAFWRVHEVHHGDRRFDAATSLRFHPLEGAIHALGVYVLLDLLGMEEPAALAIAALLAVWNVLQHGNFRAPARLSAIARVVFITPELHRTHHARDLELRDKNFGLVFTLWDRLFGTFSPVADPTTAVGVEELDASEDVMENLLSPFVRAR